MKDRLAKDFVLNTSKTRVYKCMLVHMYLQHTSFPKNTVKENEMNICCIDEADGHKKSSSCCVFGVLIKFIFSLGTM